MSAFPGPKVVSGGIVLLDPLSGRSLSTVPFQYNPDTLTRTVVPQGIGAEPGDRLEALRLRGPAHETYKLEAEFDATEVLDRPDAHPVELANGLLPVLSALASGLSPTLDQLLAEDLMASLGIIEVAPVEAPLTVLVLGARRVLPVRITDFSVTEEAFDTALQPIRAKVALSARVLTVDDLGYAHRGGQLYLAHLRGTAAAAAIVTRTPADLGLPAI